jgi:hypothetical protein
VCCCSQVKSRCAAGFSLTFSAVLPRIGDFEKPGAPFNTVCSLVSIKGTCLPKRGRKKTPRNLLSVASVEVRISAAVSSHFTLPRLFQPSHAYNSQHTMKLLTSALLTMMQVVATNGYTCSDKPGQRGITWCSSITENW